MPAVVIATDINAFHIIGGALALWAVLLAGLGVLRPEFPPKGLEKVIIAISALLVVAAISSAIITSSNEKPKGGEQAAAKGGQATPGNANKPPGQAPAQTLQLSANPTGALNFDKKTLAAKAGGVRIVLSNPAPVPHNISLQGPGGVNLHGPTVSKGSQSQVQATLKPGSYTFYCAVPGHRQAGMQGTLTVK